MVLKSPTANAFTRETTALDVTHGTGNTAQDPSAGLFARLLSWGVKSGLSIADQGLIAGSNFLLSVFLARWLTPDTYGAYAVAYSVFILLSLLIVGLLIEPMAVFGSSAFRGCVREYLGSLFRFGILISLGIASALAIAAIAAQRLGSHGALPGAFGGLSLAAPFIFLFWVARRSFYLDLAPAPAVLGAFLYSLSMLVGLLLFYRKSSLSPFTAFFLMGVAALIGTSVLVNLLCNRFPRTHTPVKTREVWNRHWNYGRWALGASVVSWIPSYIYYPLLSVMLGVSYSGKLRALMNFAQPLEQTQVALLMLFLPYAARHQGERKDHRATYALTVRLTLASLAAGALYWSLVLPLRSTLFQLLYSGKYEASSSGLNIVAIVSLLWSATYGPATVLRALESPASVFVAYSTAAFVSLPAGILLIRMIGINGAIWGIALSHAISISMLLVLLRAKVNKQRIRLITAL